jgi:hypothetical protein
VVLALGLAANTALFALVNGVLFRDPPLSRPDEIRFIYLVDPAIPNYYAGISYRDYLTLLW